MYGVGLRLCRQMAHWRLVAVVVTMSLLCAAASLLSQHLSLAGARERRAPLLIREAEEAWLDPLNPYHDGDTAPQGLLQLSCLLQQCLPTAPRVEGALLGAALEALGAGGPTDPSLTVAGYSWTSAGARVLVGRHEGALLRRMALLFPSAPPQLVAVRHIRPLQTVHIIVGIRNRQEQLKKFLQGILAQLLPQDHNFVLHIAYSSSEGDAEGPATDQVPEESSQSPSSSCKDYPTQVTEEDHQHTPINNSKVYSGERSLSHQTQQMVQELLQHMPQLKWTWQDSSSCSRPGSGFSRGCVINSAAHSLQPGDLLMLTDVDMTIDAEALRRCRANTNQGQQVYFPVAFSLFNPNGPYKTPEKNGQGSTSFNRKLFSAQHNVRSISFDEDQSHGNESLSTNLSAIVASSQNHKVNKRTRINQLERDKKHVKQHPFNHTYKKHNSRTARKLRGDRGFWRVFGFGMVCLHQEDLVRAGGLPETEGWGGEDLQFFRQLAKLKGMQFVRGAEPGLVHDYHPKYCSERSGAPGEESAGVGPSMLPHCLKSKALAEGSQEALAGALINVDTVAVVN